MVQRHGETPIKLSAWRQWEVGLTKRRGYNRTTNGDNEIAKKTLLSVFKTVAGGDIDYKCCWNRAKLRL